MMSRVGEANKNLLLVKCTWFLKKRQTVCSLLLLFQRETIPVFKGRQFRFIRWMLEQCNVRGCFHIKSYIQSSTKKIKIIFIFLFTSVVFVYEQNWKCSGPRYMYACIYYIVYLAFSKKNSNTDMEICTSTISLWFILFIYHFVSHLLSVDVNYILNL